MKKKLVEILVATVLAAVLCTACGSTVSRPTETETKEVTETQSEEQKNTESKEEEAEPEEEETVTVKENEETAAEGDTPAEPAEETVDEDYIDPDFKATMDSYEAFFDEYCAFMQEYKDAGTNVTTSMLMKYTSMLTKYSEMMEAMDGMDQSTMTKAELQYYLDVTTRIEKKLIDVAY